MKSIYKSVACNKKGLLIKLLYINSSKKVISKAWFTHNNKQTKRFQKDINRGIYE